MHSPLLNRVWNLIAAALKHGTWKLRYFICHKGKEALKKQLQDMVAMASINLHFNDRMQSCCIISSLVKLAIVSKALPSVEVTLHHSTTTQTIILTTVVKESKVCIGNHENEFNNNYNISNHDGNKLDNIDNELQYQEISTSAHNNSTNDHEEFHLVSLAGDEMIQALVNQELKDQTQVRWKKMIATKFNQIFELKGNQTKYQRTLKQRLEYVSTLSTANMGATFSNNPGHASISDDIDMDGNNIDNCPVQEYIIPSMLFASSSALAALPANPAFSSVLLPPHLIKHNMATLPSLLAISTVVMSASLMNRFLPAEEQLLKWMKECTTEKQYTRGACTIVDWRQFAKQNLYWTQVSSLFGFTSFSLWSPAQLQQKLKDLKK
jgi:hypothetical protein